MLYFFKVLDSPYFKFGWTEQTNPWDRIRTGFWTNLHPKQLCQKLSPENLELIYLFHGGKDFEGVMKSLFPPLCGEFWEQGDLESMLTLLRQTCEELPIPARPQFHPCNDIAKRACCTGILLRCFTCGQGFAKFDKLLQHKRDRHEAPRFSCVCGKKFPRKGALDRHVQKSCKGKR